MTNIVRFVARAFGYLVVGAIVLGVIVALFGGLVAIVASYVSS